MSKNCTYTLKSGLSFRAPQNVISAIYRNGGYVTSASNRHTIQVCRRVNGKPVYEGLLKDYVVQGARHYKDGNSLNITKRNLVK